MFRVRFQLTRISKLTIQKNGGDVDVVYFSSIKQATSEPSMANYYLIGVTQSGTSLRPRCGLVWSWVSTLLRLISMTSSCIASRFRIDEVNVRELVLVKAVPGVWPAGGMSSGMSIGGSGWMCWAMSSNKCLRLRSTTPRLSTRWIRSSEIELTGKLQFCLLSS